MALGAFGVTGPQYRMLTMNVLEVNSPPPFSPGLWRSESDQMSWVGAATSTSRISTEQLLELLPDTSEFALSIEVPAFGAKLTGTSSIRTFSLGWPAGMILNVRFA